MANPIKFLRGLFANLPASLLYGQPAFTKDNYRLYIGDEGGVPRKVGDAGWETRIGAAETTITDHETRLDADEVTLADHESRLDTAEDDIDRIEAVVGGIFRQAIINGNFDIWQRGTSFTNPTHGLYTADRWLTYLTANGGSHPANVIHSQQLVTPGDIFGAKNHYRVSVDGIGSALGDDSYYQLRQKIEHGSKYLAGAGKKITVSFWAKSNIVGKKLGVYIGQTYGSGGSPSAAENIAGDKFTLSTTWQKFTHTFTLNTLAGKTFGTSDNDNIPLAFVLQWGINMAPFVNDTVAEGWRGAGTIDIAQVQVCAGDKSLDFIPKSFGDELRSCKRYFHSIKVSNASTLLTSVLSVATEQDFVCHLPVDMRTNPTVTLSGSRGTDWDVVNYGGVANATGTFFSFAASTIIAYFYFASGTFTAGSVYNFIIKTVNGAINFDAEL